MYEEFSAVLAKLEAVTSARWPGVQALQARYEAELRAAYKRLHPKRKQPDHWSTVRDKLPPETAARIYDPLKAEVDEFSARSHAEEKALEQELQRLAFSLPIPANDKLRPILYEETRSSTYSSQGFGAIKYARNAAERAADDARAAGVAAEVHELTSATYRTSAPGWGGSVESATFGVLVDTSPLGLEILRRKPGAELREVVRLCWKRGVNPRVYYPFLPHGYEERAGLDYFGGEIKKAS